ncbi:MAG: DNA-directed RNA polymerase subunit beta, partial [candidate division NC10 bacterium]|nr:DNA-directed RNA polymerase subunit beta [candidate division NC10 bacterium]
MSSAGNEFPLPRERFGKLPEIVSIPSLIEIQRRSYEQFLQKETPPEKREEWGLQEVFATVFPISDYEGSASLEFVRYDFGKPKYSPEECRAKGMTYSVPLKVTLRLVVWDKEMDADSKTVRDIKEQEVYLGEMPLMTEQGTFIINGTERVVVSQLHRSPGAFFEHDGSRLHSSGKVLYSARLIPYRGSWLEFEFDGNDVLHVRIDRRRKFLCTILLRALGYSSNEEILKLFYERDEIAIRKQKIYLMLKSSSAANYRIAQDVMDRSKKEVLLSSGKRLTKGIIKKIQEAGVEAVPILPEDLVGRILASDCIDAKTGEVLLEATKELNAEAIEKLRERETLPFHLLAGQETWDVFDIRETLLKDHTRSKEEALVEIYRRLRPGDPPTVESASLLLESMFFNPKRYDLSRVGRYKLNSKLGIDEPLKTRILRREDIVEVIRYLILLKHGQGSVDDIDHLGNRRVRSVGELLEEQFRIGLGRMERAVKERMSTQEVETLMPHDLINPKPVSAALKEFFGSSQLSQFMDQTNPLAELTHKRRLSALGPGGLSRER